MAKHGTFTLAQANKVLAEQVKYLKTQRAARGKREPRAKAYIAECRYIIAIDELRRAINRNKYDKLESLIVHVQDCALELCCENIKEK